MFKKFTLLALALVMLPMSMVLAAGTANATTAVETDATLKARLISTAEVKSAVGATSSKVVFSGGEDFTVDAAGFASAGRAWNGDNGSFLIMSLLSYKDGRDISSGDRQSMISGEFASGVMEGHCGKGNYELAVDLGEVLGNDIAHGFYCKDGGKTLEVMTITFIRGNIFGIVYYGVEGSNEGDEVASSYGYLTSKLPS